MQQDRERCLAAGMQDFVTKPIEPEELWRALHKWVPPRRPDQTVRESNAAPPRSQPDAAPAQGDGLASSELALPGHVAGLNVSLGLRRVMDQPSRYIGMLRKFVASQRGATEEVQAALEAGDMARAERLAHTTKAVCGNIGAERAQALAGELEQAIKSGEDAARLHALNAALRQTLVPLVQALDAWLPPETPVLSVTGSAAVDEAALERVCRQLRSLCADMDSEAEELIDREGSLLSSAFPDHFQALSDAVRAFDFDAALAALQAAEALRDIARRNADSDTDIEQTAA